MCGRYSFTQVPELDSIILPEEIDLSIEPRYNIAPSNYAPVILQRDPRHIHYLRWGLVPIWATDEKMGYSMINARVETLHQKASFKNLLQEQRCLVLADGFYEWKRVGKKKHPHRIGVAGFAPFYMAGLASQWRRPDGTWLETFTILTTGPNDLMSDIHDRMPVILPKSAALRWLSPQESPEKLIRELCIPFDSAQMEAYEVGPGVGNVRNDDPSLISPFVEN